ncbi:MAG: hypothetical protein ABI921_11090 [Panacibacter sp.]
MKKVLLATALLITVVSYALPVPKAMIVLKASGDGRHIPASQIPAAVLSNFNSLYPSATNVKWEREREDSGIEYKADFMLGNQRWEARFASNGTFLRSCLKTIQHNSYGG